MYKRVLLKISGQVFAHNHEQGIDANEVLKIAHEIAKLHEAKKEVVLVCGAGNIWRYRDTKSAGIERTVSDYLGMMATVMNATALGSALKKIGIDAVVHSALNIPQVAHYYIRQNAISDLQAGKVVICAGGTGSPYFTTDTTAALRAAELNCEVILKATKVDGVYDADPEKVKDANKYDQISFSEAMEKNLQVMDQTAFSLCRENNISIVVFDMSKENAILNAADGKSSGTIVS